MKIRVTLRLGAGIFALIALSAEQTYGQGNNPNAYPNPYQLQENWAKLPPGRTWGSTIGIEIDPDGTSLWPFDRCAALNCRGSTLDPIMKFDPNGVMQIKFGSGLVNDPHGFTWTAKATYGYPTPLPRMEKARPSSSS